MTQLREGFTTGSCAAAAALASCLWQRNGVCPEQVEIIVPAGKRYIPDILPHADYTCGVIKDGGDDPDITTGSEIRARVRILPTDGPIRYIAGEGVGTVTLPGLKLPVGEAAVNPVPRAMIERAVRSVIGRRGAEVTVSIPGGERLAQRTFNPRLGVVGGLSVLGTTGIVRPMSEEALTATIRLEMQQRRAQGVRTLGLVFGAQGERTLQTRMPALCCVQMSNFVGFALDAAEEMGFEGLILAGQPGKLAKVCGGSMQTHSRYGDGRRETLLACLALMNAPPKLLETVWRSVTLDGCIAPVHDAGFDAVWSRLCAAGCDYCEARTHHTMPVSMMMLDRNGALLGQCVRQANEKKSCKGEKCP